MAPGRPQFETRAARERRAWWKRFLIWVFIVFFALSVAGGLIVVTVTGGR